ncbi:MAG: hypothetical protein HY959_03820 [Ignavibacteriae bacterium]|nr:hypothetical protein [Ignavibacteriota bacterium]
MAKIIPTFLADVEKGQLNFKRLELFKTYLNNLNGQKVLVSVKKYYRSRSTKQNSLYWIWLTCIGNEIGEEPEDLHSTFKAMFLTDRSKKFPIVKSTTSLNTFEFMEYMEKIARKMADFNINLPNPDEADL